MIITLILSQAICLDLLLAEDPDAHLKHLLRQIEKPVVDELAKEKIYEKNEILYCSGDTEVAKANNKAAELMENGQYKPASEILENGLKHAPLFFPFRYNLGVSYLYLREFRLAKINLDKASNIFSEYSKTYLYLGYVHQMMGDDNASLYSYRMALKKNPKELDAITMIGDIYYFRKQNEMAKKYYLASLKIDRKYPNGLLGMAKYFFVKKKYNRATIYLKQIDLTKKYNKAYHYYFAECAYNMQDYKTAYEQYTLLLKYRHDKFFLTHSISLIRHKLELTKRFVDRF